MQVAKTILEQLGGAGRLQVMTGAYNFVAYPNGVSFKFKNRKVNYVKITLNGKDLYDIEFLKLTVNSQKKVAEFEDIYFDQLIDIFENTTGMYLRLFAKGGRLKKDENIEMIFGQLKQIHHHEKELRSIIKKDKSIEPWVIAKLQRATTDLADVTHYEDNKTTKYAKGGYLEGREEYEGFQYQIWYNQNKRMYSVSDNLGIFKGDNEYFKKYDQAKEHAEMSIRSMLEKGEEYAKGGGIDKNLYYHILLDKDKKIRVAYLGYGYYAKNINKNSLIQWYKPSFDSLQEAIDYFKKEIYNNLEEKEKQVVMLLDSRNEDLSAEPKSGPKTTSKIRKKGNKLFIDNLEIYNKNLGKLTYKKTLDLIKKLGNGWRLPRVDEFKKIIAPNIDEIDFFEGEQKYLGFFWTGTKAKDEKVYEYYPGREISRATNIWWDSPNHVLLVRVNKMAKGGGIGKKIVVNTYKGKIEYTNQEIQEMIDDIDMYWDADNLPKWIYVTGKAGHPDFPKNKKQVIEVLSEIKNSKNDVYINVSSKEPYYTHIIKMVKGGEVTKPKMKGVVMTEEEDEGIDNLIIYGYDSHWNTNFPTEKELKETNELVKHDKNILDNLGIKYKVDIDDDITNLPTIIIKKLLNKPATIENLQKLVSIKEVYKKGGSVEDDITRAKSNAIDKINFEYYAKKHAGDSWNTMSKQEKAELMSELRDNWFNDSYAKGGNIYNYLVGTDFKYLGELHKVKKVENYPTYTILVTTENRRFRMDVLQEQGVKFADKPERKKRQPETAEQKRRKNAFKIKQLQYERKQLLIDMEEEAEPEGGPIANRYGRMLNKIDKQIAQLSGKDSFATGGNIEEEVSYIENRIYNLEQLKQVAGEDEQNYYSRLIQDLEREKSELLNKTSSEVPENKKKFWFFKDGGNLDSEKPIIYIEDFDAIYSGKSYGQWLDLSKFDSGQEVMEALSDIASNWSKRKGEKIETISVTDYENIPRSLYHEFMSSKDYDFIIKAYKVSKQVNIPMWVVGDVMNDYSDSFEHTLEGIKEFIEENYLGFAEDDSDLAYDYIEKNGGIKSLAEEMIKRNFDYEKYGRDVRLGMDSEQEEELGYDKLDDYDLGKELVEQYSDIRELDEKTLKSNFNYKLFGDYLTSFYANYGGHYFRN